VRRIDPFFVATLCAQWLVTAGVALTADRTGSVYGSVSSAQAAVDAARSVSDGTLPRVGGPAYPLLLAPLASLTENVDTVSVVVTVVSIALLAPLAVYCLLELAERIAGRPYALLGAGVWVLVPIAAVPLFTASYRDTYVNHVLPAVYGLAVGPAYLAMALSLTAALFAMRATAGAPRAALVAGAFAAFAAAVTPVAVAVAIGAALALVLAHRWRALIEGAIGLAAGLAPTLVWRERTLGAPSVTFGSVSWGAFDRAMEGAREHFWSNRLLQWIPIAGALGATRLVRPGAALLAGWFATFTLLVVATPSDFAEGRLFVQLIPSWPAYALLAAAIPALVPTLTSRLGRRLEPEMRWKAIPAALAVATLVLLAAVPLALVSLIAR
jgi:hypothetical protein